MLQITTLGASGMAVSTGMAPTGPAPTPPPPPPTTYPTAPSKFDSQLLFYNAVKLQPTAMQFTCTADACTGTGAADFMFRTLQNLINMGNKQLSTTSPLMAMATKLVTIAVDGRITPGTLSAYLPIARKVGGVLAIFDFTPDIKWLATNAATFAREIAQWLNLTFVESTATVPGHWERMQAGQQAVLPQPPAQPQPQQPPPPAEPTQPPPPPVMVMYVCADGSRVSDPAACPVVGPAVQPLCPTGYTPTSQGCLPVPPPLPFLQPQPQPQPQPPQPEPPTGRRYAGCIARFNKTRKVYSIYCPIGGPAASPVTAGFGIGDDEFRCLYGDCHQQLGADAVTPPVPAGFNPTPVVTTTTLPGEGETSAGEEKDKFFRANNPAMWALFAGTAAIVGGGGYWFMRRRKVGKASGFGSPCPEGQTWLESRGVCVDSKAYWDDPQRVLRKLGPRKRK
jgi:hypothetical protein